MYLIVEGLNAMMQSLTSETQFLVVRKNSTNCNQFELQVTEI